MKVKKAAIWGLLAITGLILESTLFARGALYGSRPDLLLIYSVYSGVFRGKWAGTRTGFLLGLMEDLFQGRMVGINALTKAFAGFLAGMVEKEIVKENVLISVFTVWVFSLLNTFAYGLLVVIIGYGWTLGFNYLSTVLTFALYNSLLALVLFPLMYYLMLKGPLRIERRKTGGTI